MKLAALFSGGKDSTYAIYLAKKLNYDITHLISIQSINPDSYMFHTPAIKLVKKQAELMDIPLILKTTEGVKETELKELEEAILEAKKQGVEGIITGAVESVYQATRVQKICNKHNLTVFNPLWLKDQVELLDDLVKDKFKIIISAVAAYPLDKTYVGKIIDKPLINHLKELQKKFLINPAGEGGEFESLVVNCPLFKKELNLKYEVVGEKNAWRMVL